MSTVEQLAFAEKQVSNLTGLSTWQLRHWAEAGLGAPSVGDTMYSFRDLVALKVLAELRQSVSLQELRRIDMKLRELHETPWASLAILQSDDGEVVVVDRDTGVPLGTRPRRGFQSLSSKLTNLEPVARRLRERIERLQSRHGVRGQVTRSRAVMGNQSVFSGTRIPVATVQRMLGNGASEAEILREYPSLSAADVQKAKRLSRAS